MTALAQRTRLALPLRPLFTATILLGSFLLFLIQPMFGRYVLPMLGGSPSVWNTAMLFYQTVLLLGYLYAHAMQRLPLKTQLLVHLALFVVAALTLPVAVAQWVPAGGTLPPALWLLGLLAASIGPVFFVTSAQAPLMQAWFARSDDPAAANPYFLYAASNAGSFAALIAYPLLVEPALRLGQQTLLWTGGFALLALLVATAGLAVLNSGSVAAVAAPPRVAVTWRQRGRWTLLAFVASALLLSTTTHLTTDIMAMPLLWVIPLGVYLLSFVLAFGTWGPALTRVAVTATPILLLAAGTGAFLSMGPAVTYYAVAGIVLLFVIALALHGTLANEKPEPGALTDFYVWISVGGALGGLFCAIIAPLVFDWPYEHPLLLVAAAALVPTRVILARYQAVWHFLAARWIVALLAIPLSLWLAVELRGGVTPFAMIGILVLSVTTALAIGRRLLFAWLFAMLIMALGGWQQIGISRTEGARSRSFFGVYTVSDGRVAGGRMLFHGTTNHGVQSLDPAQSTHPMTYYAPDSGVGLLMRDKTRLFGDAARVGFVGLGTGTLACYARPAERWTVFEIDPVVIDIARKQFSYLSQCRPDIRVVTGDARLTLAAEPPGGLDLLAVDAFSSDAIPLHLVTREAFAIYGRALQPGGVLLIHITNRFLDLEPVVAAIAASNGWTARVRTYRPPRGQPKGQFYTQSTWIVLTRSPERMASIEAVSSASLGAAGWQPLRSDAGMTPWTDDFASILPVLRIRKD